MILKSSQEGILIASPADGLIDIGFDQIENQFKGYREWCLLFDSYIYRNVLKIKNLRVRPILNLLNALRYLFSTYFQFQDDKRLLVANDLAEYGYHVLSFPPALFQRWSD